MQNFNVGLGQGYTDSFNVGSDVLDKYREDLKARGVTLKADDTPAFAQDFTNYVQKNKIALNNVNGVDYSGFGNLTAAFGNGGASLLNYVTGNPKGAVTYVPGSLSSPNGPQVASGAAPDVHQAQSTGPVSTYQEKMIDLGNGQQVGYDTANPQIRAAADAGTYKIVNATRQGTAPASLGTPAQSSQPSSGQVTQKNIYNPATGQYGYQVPGGAIPAGWVSIQPGQNTQVQQNQQQIPTQTGTSPTGAPTVLPPQVALQPGATGDAVKQLQDFLVKSGFMTAAQVATGPGIYGPQTTAAVAALQKSLGVDNSTGVGYYGPKTLAAVSQALSQQTSSASTSTSAVTPTSGPGLNAGSSQGGQEGSSLSSILSSFGIAASPATSLPDIISQLSKAYGITDIQDRTRALDDKYIEDVSNINDDPWLTEGVRVKKVNQLKERYDSKKKALIDELGLSKDIIGQAITLYNAEKNNEEQLLSTILRSKLETLTGGSSETTDIKEYNLAKSQGFTGSLLDWQTRQANLKRASPTTISVNTSSASSAEGQLLDARGTDGYTDPNLYASLRSRSTISANEFDGKFGYLVNPASKTRLGIKEVKNTGVGYDDI